MLRDLATTVTSLPAQELGHREQLCDAAKALYLALEAAEGPREGTALTPEQEVRLLHIIE